MTIKSSHFVCFLLAYYLPYAQKNSIPADIADSINKTLILLKTNDILNLAGKVDYPLRRLNPLPDVESKEQFVADYPIIIDSTFQQTIKNYSTSDIFEHHGLYGIFPGYLWFDESGNIVALNYSSARELQIKSELTREIFSKMYPGIKPWTENILVWDSKEFLIRVDQTDKGFRYIAWSGRKNYADKPDLILYNGGQEFQGNMGGVTYTFKKGNWTYVLDDNSVSETGDEGGMHLRILYKGVEKISYQCTAIK